MIPIRVKQFPNFVLSTIKRHLVLRRPLADTRAFHLCYFSCHSYFDYLYCSLHSLVKHGQEVPYKVWVFSDEDQPLSAEQITAIRELIPLAKVVPWPKSMGWGAAQIGSIWRAYALAAAGAQDHDIVARIDSDVYFFNDTIFQAVARSNADLIGDGHYVNFEYCQGGCYFFRASAVRRIGAMLDAEGMETILTEGGIGVEDTAAYYFAKRLGLRIWLTWFMMFPDELRRAGGLTSWQRMKFSCVHFVMKNKAAMLSSYQNDVLAGRIPENYARVIGMT